MSFATGMGKWQCRLTAQAPAQAAEVQRLFGAHAPVDADEAESEIFLSSAGDTWELRWEHHGRPGNLGLLLQSPEGRRFQSCLPARTGDREQVYVDTVLGGEAALAVADGAIRVLQGERWPLYLEFVLTWLMMREGDIVTLHAAVCAFEETAIILIGASGCGKSTLAAALAAEGADFYGDETVFFAHDRRSFSVRPKQIGLRPGGLSLLPDPPSGIWSEAKPNDPKCTVAFSAPSRPCPQAAQFYFLDGFDAVTTLTPMPSGERVLRLLRGMGHGNPSLDARLDAATEIAGHFPGWRLRLGPPAETARLLAAQARSECRVG